MYIFLQNNGFLSISTEITGHIVTMLVLSMILCLICLYYSNAIKKSRGYQDLPKLAFLIFIGIQWIRRNTYQIIGKSYHVAVPFFIYIISMFWFSNIISILGFDSLGNTIVVPATLSVAVFVGTIVSGVIYRGCHFFGDYVVWIKRKGKRLFPVVDPLKVIGELSKLLSLACRLWGNTLAGSLILFVLYHFSGKLFSGSGITSMLGPVLIPIFVFPLHIYFDIIHGGVQPMIFMLLTMCYWGLSRHGEGVSGEVAYDKNPEEVIHHNVC